jgi:hypothetical protein
MKDYNMLFESVVLSAWDKRMRREDPLGLGDADVLGAVDDKLSGPAGHNAKFGLSAALIKVAEENKNKAIYGALLTLNEKLWAAKSYNDICQILDKAETLFESIGIVVA